MSNEIAGKYFQWDGVSPERIAEILEEVRQKEGFSDERQIFCGMIY